jgi:hypothetical protein
MSQIENHRKKRAKDLIDKYFIGTDINKYFAELDELIRGLPIDYKTIADSFKHNITAVMSTTGVPVAIVASIISNYRVHDLFRRHGMNQIIEGKVEDAKNIDDKQKSEWYKIATKLHEEEMASQGEAFHHITDNINDFLLSILKDRQFEIAAGELILQGVVLTWGAFEVLSRDIFITYLNRNPDKAKGLMTDENTKRLFVRKSIDIELLHNYSYDISNSMGEVLCEMHEISSITTIRNVYKSLFPASKDLIQKLMDSNLWLLSQQRHLIVHQRGVVDKIFIDNTNLDLPIGSTIRVTPDELETFLSIVRDTGCEIIKAVCSEKSDA